MPVELPDADPVLLELPDPVPLILPLLLRVTLPVRLLVIEAVTDGGGVKGA